MPPRKLPEDEFMAAAIGDLNWLKQCIKDNKREKMDGVHFDSNGLSALHLASIHGRLECLKYLLENQGIDINLGSSNGWRPIHLCISNQTGKRAFQCLTYLLKKGADPSIANEDGITPVHQAASEGHFECLKLLLDIGAVLDARDCRKNLPIDLAKLWGHRKCAKMLANHMWHQEKEGVAEEMRQLKKKRMLEVINDLERAEEIAEQQRFFGKEAFKDWLGSYSGKKGCDREQRGTVNQKAVLTAAKTRIQSKRAAKPQTMGVSIPNSKKGEGISAPRPTPPKSQAPTSSQHMEEAPPTIVEVSRPPRSVVEASRDYIQSEKLDTNVEFTDEDLAKWGSPDPEPEEEPQVKTTPGNRHIPGVTPIQWTPLQHQTHWNTSLHVTECFHAYQPGLRDIYPRDEFTLEPHPQATPAELNPSTRDPMGVLLGEKDTELVREAFNEHILEESEEEVEVQKSKTTRKKKEYGPFRGMVYKCQTILDVPVKPKPSDLSATTSEIPLHLSSDVTSLLFRTALTGAISAQKTPTPGLGTVSGTPSKPSTRSSRAVSARKARVGQGLVVVDEEMRSRLGS